MLFDFPKLLQKHNVNITGLIHVGAHDCSEVITYAECGIEKVLLIEANTARAIRLQGILGAGYYISSSYPYCEAEIPNHLKNTIAKYEVKNYLVVEKARGKETLNIHNFDGGLDSIFHLTDYGRSTCWADFREIGTIQVETTSLDELNLTGFNFLNIDTEGAEMLVLSGAKKLLESVDYIMIETQDKIRWENTPTREDIALFLSAFGFKQVDYHDTGKDWGDALFVK